MRLAVSNIAWPSDAEKDAFRTFKRFAADAIEVAPTCVSPKWRSATILAAGHGGAATALRKAGYRGIVALEMREGDPAISALEQAIAVVAAIYAAYAAGN
jgi:hypothetical protein